MQKKNFTKNKGKNLFVGQNGVKINLTIDKTLQETISLKNLVKKNISGAVCINNLNIQIILVQNVHVDLIDDLMDFGITKSSIEVVLNKNSTLNYDLKMTNLPEFSHCNDGMLIGFAKDGCIEKELDFKFVGEHSNAKIRCACKGEDDQVFKFKTIQDHKAANTKSDLVVKGAFFKKSKLICDSLIRVDKNAQKVQAKQLNKNLLLGCNSRAISIPKLEIKADDVKCKHGAAVAKLDEDQLFYLQSRGFDYCSAKNMLVDAFLS